MSLKVEKAEDIFFDELEEELPHYEYLTEEEFAQLRRYTHYAPKTMIELFFIEKIFCHVE